MSRRTFWVLLLLLFAVAGVWVYTVVRPAITVEPTDIAPRETEAGTEPPPEMRGHEPPTLVGAPDARSPEPARPETPNRPVYPPPSDPFAEPGAPKTRKVVVHVRAKSGQPIRDVRITAVRAPWIQSGDWTPRKAASGIDGTAYIPGLPTTAFFLQILPPDPWLRPDDVYVTPEDREIEVTLREGATVSGLVIDRKGGRPEGVPVTVTWVCGAVHGLVRCDTDERGAFRLVVPDGASEVVAEVREMPDWDPFAIDGHPGFAGDDARVDGLRPGDSDVVLELGEGAVFSGVCVGPAGEIVKANRIVMIPRLGAERWDTPHRVNPETGRFHITGLRHVAYWVQVQGVPEGYLPRPPAPIRMPAKDVRLVCPGGPSSPLAEVKGVVEGQDLDDFRAYWLPKVEAWSPKPQCALAADGSFRIVSLPPGTGDLLIRKRGDDRYGFVSDVEPGDGPFDIQLKQGTPIHGRVIGWPANLRTRTLVILSFPDGRDVHTTLDAEGRFSFRGLPPADYALRTSLIWIAEEQRPPVRRVVRLKNVRPSDEGLVLDLGLGDGRSTR